MTKSNVMRKSIRGMMKMVGMGEEMVEEGRRRRMRNKLN